MHEPEVDLRKTGLTLITTRKLWNYRLEQLGKDYLTLAHALIMDPERMTNEDLQNLEGYGRTLAQRLETFAVEGAPQ